MVLSLQLRDTLLQSLEGVLDSVILLETCRWLLLESFVALGGVIVLRDIHTSNLMVRLLTL